MAEREKIKTEYEQEMDSLREQYHAMQLSKSQVQADFQALKQQYDQDLANVTSKVNAITTFIFEKLVLFQHIVIDIYL